MAGSTLETRDSQTWRLVRRQHGVVTRGQLLALGFSASAIEHRLRTGRLYPAARGVYLVGWNRLAPERRWMVAVLSCGSGACLSHRSAARLWGIGAERKAIVDITVRRHAQLSRPGIRVHVRPALARDRVALKDGIPATNPIQTLIDAAAELSDSRLERAVNEADKRDLVDPESLRAALDHHFGEPGVKRLRLLLDRDTFRRSDAELEVRFRPRAAGVRW